MFASREEAGRKLAERLSDWRGRPRAIVLGIPRSGVLTAEALSRALALPLDIFVSCRLTAPEERGLTLGAITETGLIYLNGEVPSDVRMACDLGRELQLKRLEVEWRRRRYRGGRILPSMAGRDVLVVDEGAATGATMAAALQALRGLGAARLFAALPVAQASVLRELARFCDGLIALESPGELYELSDYYASFKPVRDEQLLERLSRRGQAAGPQRQL